MESLASQDRAVRQAELKISNQFIRAKLASGVPIVQKEIPDSHTLFQSAIWGTYRYQILKRKRRGGKLRKFARRIVKRLNSKLKRETARQLASLNLYKLPGLPID